MPKCDFNKIAKHRSSPVNLLHIFKKPFLGTPLEDCFSVLNVFWRAM